MRPLSIKILSKQEKELLKKEPYKLNKQEKIAKYNVHDAQKEQSIQ